MLTPALFMDRDGTVIEERHYLSDPGLIEIFPGVKERLFSLKCAGIKLIVISNQSGIARGLLNMEQAEAVNSELNRMLHNIIDGFYICPHGPDQVPQCSCRKPGIGLVLKAGKEHDIDFSRSAMAGDKLSDVLCGISAGIRHNFLTLTGYGKNEVSRLGANPVSVIDSLAAIPDFTLES